MLNKSIEINKLKNFSIAPQCTSRQDICRSNRVLAPITDARNITLSPSNEGRRKHTGKPGGTIRKGDNCDSPKQVDALFKLVEEIKRHPECRLNASGRKYIDLETDQGQFSIPCKKVSLPSGGMLYAGRHQGRDVFSDGRNIYLEDLFSLRPSTFIPSLLMLLSQLTRVASGLAAIFPGQSSADAEPAGMPSPALGNEVGSDGGARRQPAPATYFLFPAAAADDTLWPGSNIAEHRWPDNITLVMAEHLDEEENDDDKTIGSLTPINLDYETEEDLSLRHNFVVDGQSRTLYIPLRRAKLYFDKLRYQYNRFSLQAEQGLQQLIALDDFLGNTVKNIFGLESYLDNHNDAMNTILFKLKTEILIKESLLNDDASQDSQERITHYTRHQIQIGHYIPDIEKRLLEALATIDHESLVMAMELKNGLTFSSTLNVIADRYKNAVDRDKHRLVSYYKMVYLMQKAHRLYSKQMHYIEGSTPLDRVLYHNDRDIYRALIEEDNDLLNDHSIIRIFYIIFEHNRMNDVSIHENTFLIPGELTQFGNMFEQDEKELTEEAVLTLYNKEIEDFFYDLNNKNSYLDRLFALRAQLVVPHGPLTENISWFKLNINPYLQIHASLEENIRTNIGEKAKVVMAGAWRDDFSQRLWDTKIFYSLTHIILNAQNAFIAIIKSLEMENLAQAEITREQHLAMAKIAAVRKVMAERAEDKNPQACLALYDEQMQQGHMPLMMHAAAIWRYCDGDTSDAALSGLDALSTIKAFLSEGRLLFTELENRLKENYTSIYKLKRSDGKESLKDFYDQFIEYKLHDAYMEARNQTMNLALASSMEYLDLIFPAKEVYTFKVYSRNYVQNTLTHDNWVSLPLMNIGFVSLIKTQGDKLLLISSLSNFAYTRHMSDWYDDYLVNRLIHGWNNQPINATEHQKVKVRLPEGDLRRLFLEPSQERQSGPSITEFFILAPEENQDTNPESPYTFCPIKEQEASLPLMQYIDHLNYKTLVELSESSKETLRDHHWVDYLMATIPFYTALQKNWHDADNKLAFRDVMFDLFDLIVALFPAGIAINRMTHHAFISIFNAAKLRNVPAHMLRNFILNELKHVMPNLAFYSAAVMTENLLSFINPLPFSGQLFPKLDRYFTDSLRNKLDFINESRQLKKMDKERMRSEWCKHINPRSLNENEGGIYTTRRLDAELDYFIHDGNDYFQVHWDKISLLWRVTRPGDTLDLNYAIPVKLSGNNRWMLQRAAYAAKASPLFEFNSEGPDLSPTVNALQFEPRAIAIDDPSLDAELATSHQNALRFFIDENEVAISRMLQTNRPASEILQKLVEQLSGRAAMEELIPNGHYTHQEEIHRQQLLNIVASKNKKIQYRSINFWQDVYDKTPLHQMVIALDIDNTKLIIDLVDLRLFQQLKTNTNQVHFYNDWLTFYQNIIPITFSLVKYKDFYWLNDAVRFKMSEGAAADNFVDGALLIREPGWYKIKIIRRNNINLRKTFPLTRIKNQKIRLAARSVIRNSIDIPSQVEFPPKVMQKAGMISSQTATKLTTTMSRAREEIIPLSDYLESVYDIVFFDDLLKVNEGKLLVMFNPQGYLHHVLISVGNGKFAGAGNHFFHPTLAERPAILVAEEMGTFEEGCLRLREGTDYFQVSAGNARGAPETLATMAGRLPFKTVIEHREGEQDIERIVTLTREETLLGEDWSMQQINGLKTRILIRAHGAPFNINHMDALELSHVVRGLALANPHTFNLKNLQSIELYSCFSGYGGKYSTAQILANELNVPVKAYPAKISQQILQRNPRWFTLYRPSTASAAEGMSPATFTRMNLVSKRHIRLHDLVSLILHLKHTTVSKRGKRLAASSSSIYINIARLLMEEIDLPEFLQQHAIDQYSQYLLSGLIKEYALGRATSDDIFIQAYLDVLYSVEAFKHLTKTTQWLK